MCNHVLCSNFAQAAFALAFEVLSFSKSHTLCILLASLDNLSNMKTIRNFDDKSGRTEV